MMQRPMQRRPSRLQKTDASSDGLPSYETNAFKRKNSRRALNPFRKHKRSFSDETVVILALFAAFACLVAGFLVFKALFEATITTSEYSRAPHMVLCDLDKGLVTGLPAVTSSHLTEGAFEFAYRAQHVGEKNNDDGIDNSDEEECVYRDWQTKNYIQCNSLHEISMFPEPDYFEFINCGGSRCAFRLTDVDQKYIVLKTQKYRNDFDQQNFLDANKDAMVMERLTASPYVADIFTACGATQVIEYSEGGNIHDLIKIARLAGEDKMSSIDKLRICAQIAAAVADMHSFEKDGVPSLSHNDLCCHQFLLVDGVYKLNDFHLAKYMKKNKNTNEMCPSTIPGFNSNLYKTRSQEEHGDGWWDELDLPQVDTFMMADVMFYVLTKLWMWEGITTKKAKALTEQGGRPEIPRHILTSEDPAIKAMVKAIKDCWIGDPKERPRSRQISDFLREELRKIEGVEELGVVRVSIPPLPKNHRYTDNDFYRNLLM